MSGKMGVNPMEAFRKAEKKRESEKNKEHNSKKTNKDISKEKKDVPKKQKPNDDKKVQSSTTKSNSTEVSKIQIIPLPEEGLPVDEAAEIYDALDTPEVLLNQIVKKAATSFQQLPNPTNSPIQSQKPATNIIQQPRTVTKVFESEPKLRNLLEESAQIVPRNIKKKIKLEQDPDILHNDHDISRQTDIELQLDEQEQKKRKDEIELAKFLNEVKEFN